MSDFYDYKEVLKGHVQQRRYRIEPAEDGAAPYDAVTDHYGAKCNSVINLGSVSPAFKRAQVVGYIEEAIKETKALDAIQVKKNEERYAQGAVSARRSLHNVLPQHTHTVAVDPLGIQLNNTFTGDVP